MSMQKTKISIAYSPDTDDQFMILALRNKLIDWQDFQFDFIVDDIQKLNEAAKNATYDITAISVGAYPLLRDKYLLMPIGASIGDEFGPAIVTKPDSHWSVENLAGKRIAVPGLNTSACIAAQTLFGPFVPVPMYFLDIQNAVLSGEVDAGVLIHELQLNPETHGLRKITDLGRLWHDRFQLPLPLGANAVKRDLTTDQISRLSKIYRDSILYGLHSRKDSIQRAVASAAAKESIDEEMGDRYISMYVNERSLAFQADSIAGIKTLFDAGAKQGIFEAFDFQKHICQ